MTLLVVGLLATATGFVAYHDSAAYVRRFDVRPFGRAPATWTAVAVIASAALAFLAAPIVIGALSGYVGFRRLGAYEERNHEPLFGVSALLGAAACAIFGLFGALFTPVLLWMFVCAFTGLAGVHLLLVDEQRVLLYDKQRLQNENRQLLAARAARPPVPTATTETPSAQPPTPAPTPAPEPVRRPLAAWTQPAPPPSDAWLTNFETHDRDLLPRRG